jgi:hypothetical protein
MATTVKTFGFVLRGGKPKPNEIPVTPAVNICVKRWATSQTSNQPLISPDLVTDGEIDWHIDALKADLEAVRSAAKRALGKAEDDAQSRAKRE